MDKMKVPRSPAAMRTEHGTRPGRIMCALAKPFLHNIRYPDRPGLQLPRPQKRPATQVDPNVEEKFKRTTNNQSCDRCWEGGLIKTDTPLALAR